MSPPTQHLPPFADTDSVKRVRSTVRRFFERQLPALLRQNRGVLASSTGTIAFVIDGVGDWTVRLGAPDLADAVVEETCFRADLTLMFSASAFAALLEGVAPIPGRGFAMSGDAKLLRRLSRVLPATSGGIVAARAAAL